MTRAERDRLRGEALRLAVEAAIAAGVDLGFQRAPVVKALLRQGAGRTFAYDVVAEVVDGGEVEAELTRRGFIRSKADAAPAQQAKVVNAPAPPVTELRLTGAAVARALALLDQAGELLVDGCDHVTDAGQALLIDAMRATEAVEAILRGEDQGAGAA